VNTLQADRRWCLTGTPIQNRLEDLGALIRFLKVEPFDSETSKVAFRRYIVDPLSSNDEDPCRNLRLLLRSVCLRRTTQNQSDLTARYESVTLSLSALERSLYHKFLEQTKSHMDMLVSTGSCFQEFTKLFTIVLRLRMLCNLGKFCKGLDSQPFPMAATQTCFPADLQICGDLGCDLCEQEESMGLMKGLTFCPGCSRPLFSINLPGPNCISETLRLSKLSSPQFSYLSNEPSEAIRSLATSQQSFLEAGVSAEGYPTKLFAVAKNLRDNISHSKRSVKP
jgi:SNF2-related domain